MIDIEETINLRGYDPLMLTFGSNKEVWAVCNMCGNGRWLQFKQYSDLCKKCGHNTSEYLEAAQLRATKQFASQEAREEMSNIKKQFYIDNPEAIKAARLKSITQWSSQKARDDQAERKRQFYIDNPESGKSHSEWMIRFYKDNPEALVERTRMWREYWLVQANRDSMSEIKKNSEATLVAADAMRGGYDIVNHHFIYDHNNPDQHTIEITRSEHTSHHNRMRKNGLEVLHLNVTEENKDV